MYKVQDYDSVFFTTMMLTQLYVKVAILYTVNSKIIAFIYYCDLRKFSQIEIYIIAKHEVLQYKCEV